MTLCLKKLFTYLIVASLPLLFFSCKQGEKTASAKSTRGNHDIEPDELNPRVDTRFQEVFFQAQLEKSKGNAEKAYSLFQDCLKEDPASAAVHYELGRIDLSLHSNPANAVSHAKAAVAADKNNSWYQLLLGDCYMAQGSSELAAKAYKEVYRINPDNKDALYLQANALLYAGKTQDAIAIYDLVEKDTGPYDELSMQKHQLYLQLGNNVKAGEELEKLAKAYPDEPRYWGLAAQFYRKTGMTEKARYATEQMLQNGADNGQVHFQLSEMYAESGDDQKSFDEMKLAFASSDVDIDQKINVLLRYFTLTGKEPAFLNPAYELLKILKQSNPDEAKTYSIYGDFLYRDKKPSEALVNYRKASDLDPSRQLIWEQILIVEGELGEFEWMLTDSKKACELFPTLPQFYLFNGIAHQQDGDIKKAIEAYNLGKELVIEDDEMLMRFYSYLGEAYHKQQEYDKSDQAYDKALKIDGNNVFVLNNYAYYLSLRKTKLVKAEQMAQTANKLVPNQASFEDTYAWVLFQQGKYQEALAWIQKALSHANPDGALLEHYGDILFMSGDVTKAVEEWKKAEQAGGAGDLIKEKIEQKKYLD